MGSVFKFDKHAHEYSDELGVIPHITGMLERTGWVDDTFMTAASADRGTCVHTLTADYDLGALTVESCVSKFRPYLLAHAKAMDTLRPAWSRIEVPMVHSALRFGGRPDRVGHVLNIRSVLEIKSGVPTKSHAIQMALQAILAADDEPGLPAEHYQRLALYLKPSGRYSVTEFVNRSDFNEAHRIIGVCCEPIRRRA